MQLFYHKPMKIDKIPVRRFEVELKHRPPDDATGDREVLITTLCMEVPRLANSEWEKRWCALSVWNLFNSEEAKAHKINQAFIFSADFKELIMRLEINEFQDEEPHKLHPPNQKEHDKWHHAVTTKFAQLYGRKLSEWLKQQPYIKSRDT
jgi:hypothetical protein